MLNGLDRRIWGNDNGYFGKTNKSITYTFDGPQHVNGVRLVMDSDLDREYTEGDPEDSTPLRCYFSLPATTKPHSVSSNA